MFVLEQKGTTLHLLKQSSKPVPQIRKRVKRNVFNEGGEEVEMIDLSAVREKLQSTPSIFGQSTPNIIGNQEDKGFDPNSFQSIAARRGEEQKDKMQYPHMASRRNKSKERGTQQ